MSSKKIGPLLLGASLLLVPALANASGAERIQAGQAGATAGLRAPGGFAPHAQVSLGTGKNGGSRGEVFVGASRRGLLATVAAGHVDVRGQVGQLTSTGTHGAEVSVRRGLGLRPASARVDRDGVALKGPRRELDVGLHGVHLTSGWGIRRMSRIYAGRDGLLIRPRGGPGPMPRGLSGQGVNLTRRSP